MESGETKYRRLPADFETRAYVLGLSLERAKFLVACPHTENLFNKKDKHVVVVPFDEMVQIKEARRLGIGAVDAAKLFNKTPEWLLSMGFALFTHFPKPPGNGDYSLFAYEDHQEITRANKEWEKARQKKKESFRRKYPPK